MVAQRDGGGDSAGGVLCGGRVLPVLRGCAARTNRVARDGPAALCALNPNLLYLQSTAMTEAIFFACLAALL